MITKLPPSPYNEIYTSSLPRRWHDLAWVIDSADSSIEPMADDARSTWRELEPLLMRLKAGDQHPVFGRVSRLEFVLETSTAPRAKNIHGVVLFDASGVVITHVTNALLGYWGSGPDLSWDILEALEAPRSMFEHIQAYALNRRPYGVVVSRERTSTLPGFDGPVVIHDEPLEDEWTYWVAP